MNTKQRRTLAAIFRQPVPATLPWDDLIALFRALGATVSEGRGSRVRVELNEHESTFLAPHPQRVANQGRLRAAREFLEKAGVKP
jgi:hypothetical protein